MEVGQGSLDKLPAEILLAICSRLSYRDRIQFKSVCKRCYDVTSDPHLWREITWSNFASSETTHVVNILHRYSANITKLVVCGHFQFSSFSQAIGECSSLRVLVVLGLRTLINDVTEAMLALPHLKRLEFEPRNSQCSIERCQHLMCFPDEWREFLPIVSRVQTVVLVIPYADSAIEFFMREWTSHNYYPLQFKVKVVVRQSLRRSWESQEMGTPFSNTMNLWRSMDSTLPSCDHNATFQVCPYRSSLSFGLKLPPLFELHVKPGGLLSDAITVVNIDNLDGSVHFVETTFETGFCSTGRYSSEDCSESTIACSLQDISTQHITYLNFSGAKDLLSEHLETVASVCPHLSHLNLMGCVKCFAVLFGIAALVAKCAKLKALNVQQIPSSNIEHVGEFWQYLRMFSNLIHLSINLHLIHTTSEMTETQLETTDSSSNALPNVCELELLGNELDLQYNSHPLLTQGVMSEWNNLRHLRVETTVQVPGNVFQTVLNGALVHCRALKCLYISSPFTFTIHPESLLSSPVEQVFIMCQRLNISDILVNSIVSSKITHLYLFVRSISKESVYTILENTPAMVSCCIYTRDRPVFRPPNAVLKFRKRMKEVVQRRSPSLDDFVYQEDVTSNVVLWINNATAKSVLNSNLISIWL